MTIVTESLGISGSNAILYEDESGGELQFVIVHPDYTSSHILRVIPFGSSGSGIFNSPPSGTTANLSEEAQNLTTLIAACYAATGSVTFIGVNQVLSDHTGVQPYPYSFSGTVTAAGTAGGTALLTYEMTDLVGKGTDGTRWNLQLPGVSNAVSVFPGRVSQGVVTGALHTLLQYLTGQANGPTVAKKTNVVTHSGVAILNTCFVVSATNKRLRRHFKVA